MQLNREALLKFIEWAEDHSDRLAPYEESVDLITAIGLRCRLACMQRQESAEVVITSLSPKELESTKIGVLSNIGPLTIEEYGMRQSEPNTFEKGGRFFFPIDEFQLLIEWGRKEKLSRYLDHISRVLLTLICIMIQHLEFRYLSWLQR